MKTAGRDPACRGGWFGTGGTIRAFAAGVAPWVWAVAAMAWGEGVEPGPGGVGRGWGGDDPLCRPALARAWPADVEVPAGTRRMVERLARVRAEALEHPEWNPFLNGVHADRLQGEFDAAQAAGNAPRMMDLWPKLARELLQAGRNEAALREYREYRRVTEHAAGRLDSRQSAELARRLALTHLRIGEQDNCLDHHSPDSCLLPIRGGGVHRYSRGSQAAVGVLTGLLSRGGEDRQAQWLLNLAWMTLGGYPDQVPARWRIPPSAFAPEHDVGRFPDVAAAAGVDVEDLSGGVVAEDLDGDGWLDLMVSASGLGSPLRYFRNNQDGTFEERTGAAGLSGLTGGLNLIQGDDNNDGHVDVLVLRGGWLGRGGRHPNSLLRNRGDGTFEDVTEAAGLLSFHPTQAAVWLDYDGDGWLDLFIGNESRPDDPHPCELFRNNRDGTFTECAAGAGAALTGFFKGVASADYNRDGRPDLYLSDGMGPNRLLRNEGPMGAGAEAAGAGWRFTEVSVAAGVTEPERSFPTWFWDYDNDGWADLFVCGYGCRDVGDIAAEYLGLEHGGEVPRLYRNQGDGTFQDVTREARLDRLILGMGANFGDLDNDGWLDCFLGTGDPDLAALMPNRVFRNADGRFFQEVTTSGGFGHVQKGHGIAFADLDNDGDQDVYAVMGGAMSGDGYRNALYRNPGHGHRWLTLKLEGVTSNRAAIGARIRVVVETGTGTGTGTGERSIHRTVGSGGSFGASPLRQEIGLGPAQAILRVEVVWPVTGRTQTVSGLVPDREYRIREEGVGRTR